MTTSKRQNIDDYRALLFFRQSMIARWLGDSNPVFACQRNRIPNTDYIGISKKADRARYKNLQHCKRLWLCPVCANAHAKKRREQLQRAIEAMRLQGFALAFVTYTVQHRFDDTLETVRDRVLEAHKAMHSGRAWQAIETEFEWAGSIKVVEITYTQSGWHFHLHEVGFVADDCLVPVLQTALSNRWQDCLHDKAGYADNDHGLRVEAASTAVRDYVSKWGIVPELASGQDKNARRGGVLPFQLADYLITNPKRDSWCERTFREYAEGTKGIKQIWASPNVRPYMAEPQLTFDKQDTPPDSLSMLTVEQWTKIWKSGLRSKCLIAAENNQLEEFLNLL